MPTYDYECKECGYEFEHFQSMSEDTLKECPQCGGELRRLIGGGMGIIFRGSGFYVTDNRGSDGGNGQKSAGKGEEKTAEKSGESSSAAESSAGGGGEHKSGSSSEAVTSSTEKS
jgi:putative FmdB family regulatory protein